MSCVGLAERAQELAVNYARQRVTFGKPIASRQAVAFMIAENEADIQAARALVFHAAEEWELDSDRASALSSMAVTAPTILEGNVIFDDDVYKLTLTTTHLNWKLVERGLHLASPRAP